MSYKMPTYTAGGRRVLLAAWKHGISVYGWRKDDDGGFVERHPNSPTHWLPHPGQSQGLTEPSRAIC